jgi:dTDP-4-dehydrorhamnose 3,5-epimerase
LVTVTATRLPEVLMVEPKVFGDERGFFLESWNQAAFDQAVGQEVRFVQDNHSRSAKGVLRGLHYQLTRPQGKLVRVTAGRVFDVAVDMRRSSPRLGRWVGAELSAQNKRQMWIPAGFAHGFLVLSEWADFLYKATDYYVPRDEKSLAWDDPKVGVAWPLEGPPSLSGKDAAAPGWDSCELFDR